MVLESTLEQVMVTAIIQALCDKDHFLITLQNNIETVICDENSHTFLEIDKQLVELQTELLKLAVPRLNTKRSAMKSTDYVRKSKRPSSRIWDRMS